MAEDTVDEVLGRLGRKARCRTKRLRLLGADGYHEAAAGTPAAHLGDRYGTLAGEIEALVAADPSLGEPLVPGLPYLRAEAVYAVRARDGHDARRRAAAAHPGPPLRPRRWPLAAAPAVAELIAAELGWDADATARQVAAYRALVATEEADAQPARRCDMIAAA